MKSKNDQPYLCQDLEKIIQEYSFKDNHNDIQRRWNIGRRLMQENVIMNDLSKSQKNKEIASSYLNFKFGTEYNLKSLLLYENFFNQYLNLDKEFQNMLLSWNSYLILMKMRKKEERQYFEREAMVHHWNEKQLKNAIKRKRPMNKLIGQRSLL